MAELLVQVRKNNDVWIHLFRSAEIGGYQLPERRSWRKWLWPPGEPFRLTSPTHDPRCNQPCPLGWR